MLNYIKNYHRPQITRNRLSPIPAISELMHLWSAIPAFLPAVVIFVIYSPFLKAFLTLTF